MEKMNGVNVVGYYGNLPRGKKDSFVREVADEIGKSVSAVQKKLTGRGFTKLELERVVEIIQKREA